MTRRYFLQLLAAVTSLPLATVPAARTLTFWRQMPNGWRFRTVGVVPMIFPTPAAEGWGTVSSVSIWTTALPASECAALVRGADPLLARGADPLLVRPSALLYHVPLIGAPSTDRVSLGT